MTSVPSFERIDYQLRYNKHIERKMVFDMLQKVHQHIGFRNHRYLGFGSMWFADFRLAHRLLGIHDMVSMERAAHSPRAKFNSPYKTIRVEGGESTATLDKLDWVNPTVAWLDYDGGLTQSVASDMRKVLEKSRPDSVVIVTVNASRGTYRPRQEGPRRERSQTALGQVEELLVPGVVPARFEPTAAGASHGDIKETEFPEFLSEAILGYMRHVVAQSGRMVALGGDPAVPVVFLPLFNFCHKDNAEMITVGGALTPLGESPWEKYIVPDLDIDVATNMPRHLMLNMVPLTLKEKIILDSCLPADETDMFVERAKEEGIELADDELRKYWRHYRHFPVFFEAPV